MIVRPATKEDLPAITTILDRCELAMTGVDYTAWTGWLLVAERQGQTAARNMLGKRETFDAVPFFWSQHYDVPINYVGHAEQWDEIAVDGDIGAKDCVLRYKRKGRVLAVASIYRDLASLQAELAMERRAAV